MRPISRTIASSCLFIAALLLSAAPVAAQEAELDYTTKVKPLFAHRCASCHGALQQKSGLRLDTASFILQGGKHGAVILPGKSAESKLIQAVTGVAGVEQMPAEGKPLTAEEVEVLKRWIDAGAPAPADEPLPPDPRDHWSFQPPLRPAVPAVANSAWVRNPIDAFVAAEHEKRGLKPVGEAEKHVLLRRLYLDLIGLPPTQDALQAFLADTSPDAYEQVVDRLLASPQYGERWGRHWMDVWRYSDWAGFGAEVRDSQPHIWRWRDWIIESLNADKPYDRMIVEMLAADEAAPADPDAVRATGYLARSWYKFNRNVWLENVVEHTGKAFLGLTLNCAKCHDHMYDPISQKEHYQFRAFFEPYNVRTDRIPAHPDPAVDGLTRVFDEKADAQTFLFVRGNEKQPVEDEPLLPAAPAVLGAPAEAKPVNLPPIAYYPGLQPGVQQNAIETAASAVPQAETALAQAAAALTDARQQHAAALAAHGAAREALPVAAAASPEAVSAAGFLEDSFDAARADVWSVGAGEWVYRDGILAQSQTGAEERAIVSLLDHPTDFTATVKFKITGGQQWCSVGLNFDVTEANDAKSIYLSAHAGGPSVSLYYRQAGQPIYPPDAALPAPIKLGQEYALRVDVRDALVNIYVDDTFVRAYRFPPARQPGRFSLWAFDAAAEFLSVRVARLADDVKLSEAPANGVTPPPVALTNEDPLATAASAVDTARQNASLAALRLGVARADAAFAVARVAADNAKYASPPAPDAEALALKAGRAERELAVWRGKLAVLEAEHALAAARAALNPADVNTANAVDAALVQLAEKQTALCAAHAAVNNPSSAYSPLTPVYPATSTGRRLALANWIASKQNPLTARVAINHIWLRHFGEGLVPTIFDFGLNGRPPLNPALLDWLAVELMERGWSQKAIHRLIVTSSTYRLRSDAAPDDPNKAIDPDNIALWRANVGRMEAEAVRDSLLQAGGVLDLTIGGPDIDYAQGLTSQRRSLYFRHAHEKQMVFLKLFDAANPNECYRRDESVMPQQALALANSPIALANGRRLAATLTQRVGAGAEPAVVTAFVAQAFEAVLCRPPTDAERAACEDFVVSQTQALADPSKLTPFAAGEAAAVPPSTDPHQRARENLVHVLLNHNDFVTIR